MANVNFQYAAFAGWEDPTYLVRGNEDMTAPWDAKDVVIVSAWRLDNPSIANRGSQDPRYPNIELTEDWCPSSPMDNVDQHVSCSPR